MKTPINWIVTAIILEHLPPAARGRIHYRSDKAACVIYSCGRNQTDDGGAFEGPESGTSDDIGFKLVMPGN